MNNKIHNPEIIFKGRKNQQKLIIQNNDKYVYPQQIFQPPAFMFQMKNQSSFNNNKKSYETLNGFKPKLQSKSKRNESSTGMRSNTISNKINNASHQKNLSIKIKLKERFQQYKEAQLKKSKKELFDCGELLNIRPIQNVKRTDDTDLANEKQSTDDNSPYFQFSSNSFPRKQQKNLLIKCKNFDPTKSEILMELNKKLTKDFTQKMNEIEIKYTSQQYSRNSLELMTIFSIKEQSKPTESLLKKKKQIIQQIGVSKEKQKSAQIFQKIVSPNRYMKKQIVQSQELIADVSADKIYAKKIKSFIEFVTKVNYSNNFVVSPILLTDKYQSIEKVKVYVGNGNNKHLIIALLKRRFWLEITKTITKDTKFIWTQNSMKQIHDMQKSKEALPSVQTKILKQMIEDISLELPVTFEAKSKEHVYNKTEERRFISTELNFKNVSTNFQNRSLGNNTKHCTINFRNKKKNLSKNQYNYKLFLNQEKGEKIQFMLEHQLKKKVKVRSVQMKSQNLLDIQIITNHIPHNTFIGSKKALFHTMEHYYKHVKKINPFQIIPKTYHFKSTEDESYSIFLEEQKKIFPNSIWIVKPGECTNRGNGIKIMRASEISKKILKKQFHQNGQQKTTIVQKYLTDTLLYNGRKFDIRHYMMISVINGNLKAYWYSEGYLRTSSQYFNLEDLSEILIHLTNDAIQKDSEEYGKYQPGNKLSYNQFQRYLDQNYSKKQINFKDILQKMKSIATDVVKANYKNLDRNRKMNNFQIFGLDFMIDSKFRPWLIEINANPCLEMSCPLLERIIPIMVEHTFRLGLDPLIGPRTHYPQSKRYYLSDNFLQNLRYEIIFDELEEKEEQNEVKRVMYDLDFDEAEDQYENEGNEIDLSKLLD